MSWISKVFGGSSGFLASLVGKDSSDNPYFHSTSVGDTGTPNSATALDYYRKKEFYGQTGSIVGKY